MVFSRWYNSIWRYYVTIRVHILVPYMSITMHTKERTYIGNPHWSPAGANAAPLATAIPQHLYSIYDIICYIKTRNNNSLVILCVSLRYLCIYEYTTRTNTLLRLLSRGKNIFLSNILFVLYLFYGKYIVLLFSAVRGWLFKNQPLPHPTSPFPINQSVYFFLRCFCSRKWRHEICVEETCNNNITTSIIQV